MSRVVVFDCCSIKLDDSLWLWSHMNLTSPWSCKLSNEVEEEFKNEEDSIMLCPCHWLHQSL